MSFASYLTTLQAANPALAETKANYAGEAYVPAARPEPLSVAQAFEMYNKEDPKLAEYVEAGDPVANNVFQMANYFKEGQMAPGSKSIATPEAAQQLYDSAQVQWKKDDAPSFLDKLMEKAAVAAVIYAGGQVAASAMGAGATAASAATPTLETALETAGVSAAKNAAVQLALTGKVDPKGLLAAGAGGFAGSYVDGAGILGGAAKGATVGGVQAAVGGGDILKGATVGGALGATGEAVKPLTKAVLPADAGQWATGGFAGAVSGAVKAAITGGDVLTGALGGGVAGVTTGALHESGVGDVTSGILGNVAGALTTKTDTTNINTMPAVTPITPPTTAPANNGMGGGFSAYIQPTFVDLRQNRDLSRVLPTGT